MSTAAELQTIILGPQQNGILMTPEEFDAVTDYDELYNYELIHGVLVVNAIPLPQERGPNEELGYLLLNYHYEHPQGTALDDTLVEEYVRTADSRRRADRIIWAGLGRQPDPRTDIATIVVEFVSEGRRSWRRDYIEKRNEYLTLGVTEYWVIDRFERTLTVFRRAGEAAEQQVIPEGEVYRPGLLPGFELPLARILAVADRWSAK